MVRYASDTRLHRPHRCSSILQVLGMSMWMSNGCRHRQWNPFTSQEFIDAADKVGYRIKHTTPYHPQSNGMAERRFRELEKAIRIYSQSLYAWEDIIPEVLLAFHNT